eukprot:TRINITY_DN2524_c0_g2_i2.p1 TRINITY_DN2524_c0_g2~~TRINITY_DN2524_c0_g2_i2.p1  ORF type:complete len:336 (+),score=90.44 TRINITY_DN2524_c0_g2_i2:133-1140(+)
MIRRPPRSTLSSSSAASDVYKRQGINAEYGNRRLNPMSKSDAATAEVELRNQDLPVASGDDGDNMPTVWRRRAVRISWVSIGLTMASGIAGIVIFAITGSTAMLGYGLESFVDVFSSAVVLWRFSLDLKPLEGDGIQHSKDLMIYATEKKAGVMIAFTFVAIALVVGGQAIGHMAHHTNPDDHMWLVIFAGISFLAFMALGLGKYMIADALESSAMLKDAYCSIAVSVLSLGVMISVLIYRNEHSIWFLDAVIALIVSVVLFVYGVRTIAFHGHHWWRKDFWSSDPQQAESEFGSKIDHSLCDHAKPAPLGEDGDSQEIGAVATIDTTRHVEARV